MFLVYDTKVGQIGQGSDLVGGQVLLLVRLAQLQTTQEEDERQDLHAIHPDSLRAFDVEDQDMPDLCADVL